MERGRGMAGIIAACLVLTLFAVLVGCDSAPAPPTPVLIPTIVSRQTPTVSLSRSPTPRLIVPREPLLPNPLVNMRDDDLSEELLPVVDSAYCTSNWSANDFPATLTLPVEPVRGDLLLVWNSSATSDYTPLPDAPTYGVPASYTISTSDNSTDGEDGTWRTVVKVDGNTARTRAHRFPFEGARWVRMTITSAVPGPLGDRVVIDQIDLHDASRGTEDTVFFLGDSITVAAFTRCPDSQPSFAELVRRASPRRFPAMIDGGVAGVNSGYGVSVVEQLLDLNPDFHVWAIGYGTNDAWQKTPPSIFEDHLQAIVAAIQAAGRVPILARIPFAARGPDDADVRALNRVIDRVTTRQGLLPGPDLYTWFSTHPDELGPDGVHPSAAGSRSINRLWYEALRPFYGTVP